MTVPPIKGFKPDKIKIVHIKLSNGDDLLGTLLKRTKTKAYIAEPLIVWKELDNLNFDPSFGYVSKTLFCEYSQYSDDPIYEFNLKDIQTISNVGKSQCGLYFEAVDLINMQRDEVKRLETKKKKRKREQKNLEKEVLENISQNKKNSNIINFNSHRLKKLQLENS